MHAKNTCMRALLVNNRCNDLSEKTVGTKSEYRENYHITRSNRNIIGLDVALDKRLKIYGVIEDTFKSKALTRPSGKTEMIGLLKDALS